VSDELVAQAWSRADLVAPSLDTTLSPAAVDALARGIPESTRSAYDGDWKRFTAWCAKVGRRPMPATPETVTEYATHLAYTLGRAPATIDRALSSIRVAHRSAAAPLPDLLGARKVLVGYVDELSKAHDPMAKPRKAAAAGPEAIRAMVATLDRATLAGKRNAVLLLLGFATAARRSELVALNLGNVVERIEGLDVAMYRGKRKERQDVAVLYGSDPATCPVRAFQAWKAALAEHGRHSGPLLVRIDQHSNIGVRMTRHGVPIGDPDGRLTGQAVSNVVAASALRAGLTPEQTEGAFPHWSGHSLRRGFATAARNAGHDLLRIGRHGGWADGSRALLGYIEEADRWSDSPLRGIGL
jgi:site-specific recombinase XerD